MAGTVRKSGKQVQARQRAREKAAEFRAKQDRLEQLAADYFVAADELDQIADRVVEEITRVRERGERDGAAARERGAAAVAEMLALGASRSEVAERLGIAVRELPKPITAAAAEPTPASGAEETAPGIDAVQSSTPADTASDDTTADEPAALQIRDTVTGNALAAGADPEAGNAGVADAARVDSTGNTPFGPAPSSPTLPESETTASWPVHA